MASNVTRICVMCGRTFNARKGKFAFCSVNCKKRYGNHKSFTCDTCRTLPCEFRQEGSQVTPKDCPNLKWHW